MNIKTKIILSTVLLFRASGRNVHSASVDLGEDLDTQDKTGRGPKDGAVKGWETDNIVKRLETRVGNIHPADTVNIDHSSLKNGFDNATLPPLLCWEMHCPDCSPLETPQRCFARGVTEVALRSMAILFVLAPIIVYLLTVRPKKKSTESREKTDYFNVPVKHV